MSSRLFPRSLGRIRVPLGRKPMNLQFRSVPPPRGRLEVLRRIVTDLFRDERIELPQHRAFEARAYAERLIQLAIEYGDRHKLTMEICEFWLLRAELIHKLFKVLVPRFRSCPTAYTNIWSLQPEYEFKQIPGAMPRYQVYKRTVLELKGNPFPPVVPRPESRANSLLNILLEEARKRSVSPARPSPSTHT